MDDAERRDARKHGTSGEHRRQSVAALLRRVGVAFRTHVAARLALLDFGDGD